MLKKLLALFVALGMLVAATGCPTPEGKDKKDAKKKEEKKKEEGKKEEKKEEGKKEEKKDKA